MTDIITNLKPGDKVRVLHAVHLPEKTGKVVEFVDYAFGKTYGDLPHPYEVTHPGDTGSYYAAEVEVVERQNVVRPTIDFSGDRRKLTREYAGTVNSRILDKEHRATLAHASNGGTVDAYALNAALTAAMSSCATRAGTSPARRELTKKVRHLAYITQAVIENHADGLPVYAEGDRSRLVEDLKTQVSVVENEREAYRSGMAEAQKAALTAIYELERTAEALGEAKGETERVLAIAAERDSIIVGLSEDLTRHVALREYVEDVLLNNEQRHAVAGFTYGYVFGQRD